MMRDAWVSQALLPEGAEVMQRHHTGCWALRGVEKRNTSALQASSEVVHSIPFHLHANGVQALKLAFVLLSRE